MGDIKIYFYNVYESKYILNFQKDEIETLNFNKIKEIIKNKFNINLNEYDFFYKNDMNSCFDENNIQKLIEQGIIIKSKKNMNEYEKMDNLKKEIEVLKNELKEINKKTVQENYILSVLKSENENWERKVINKVDEAVAEQIKLDKISNELVSISELINKEQNKYDEIKKNITEKSNIYEKLAKNIEEKTEISRILDDNVTENNFKLIQYDEEKKKFDEEINKKKNEYIDLFRRIKEINSFYLDNEKNFKTQMMNKKNYKKTIEENKVKIQNNIKENMEKYINSLEQNFLREIKNKCFQNLKLHINKLQSYEKKRNDDFEKKKKFYEKTKSELIGLAKLNNLVHYGKICKKCNKNPIKGILYKCCKCDDFNLCEKCEEINFLYGNHPHHFIKIRKEFSNYEIDSNNMEIIKKNKINNNQNDYQLLEFEDKELFELKEKLNKINIKNNNKYQLFVQSNSSLCIKGKNKIDNNNILHLEEMKNKLKIKRNINFDIISNKLKQIHPLIVDQCINMTLDFKNIDKYNNPNLKDNIEEKKNIQNQKNQTETNILNNNNFYDINSNNYYEINKNKENERNIPKEIEKQNLNSVQNEAKKLSNYSGLFSAYPKKNNENQNNIDYSWEYSINQSISFNKNDQNKIIKFRIKNNGNNQWIENQTFLTIKNNNNFTIKNNIPVKPLKKNENQDIEISLGTLVENNFLSNGKYVLEIDFIVNKKKYGNSLQITFEIQ